MNASWECLQKIAVGIVDEAIQLIQLLFSVNKVGLILQWLKHSTTNLWIEI